jgi:membrane protein DedA with SNARE-associated domain
VSWIDFENITYVGLFLALIGGALGLPIPEDAPLIAAGALSQVGTLDIRVAFLVCYAGILIGDTLIFFVGHKLGPSLFEKEWFKKRVPSSRIRLIRQKLSKRSLLTILIARHLFYLRTVTFLTCGAVGMRYSRFILSDALAALISAPVMLAVGYFASEHFDSLVKNGHIILGVLAFGLLCYYGNKYFGKTLKKS